MEREAVKSKEANALAERIVTTLMTAGDGKVAKRLVLWDDDHPYLPDRGGLVASSAIREVARVLMSSPG